MVTPKPSKPEIFVQYMHSKPEILLQNIWGFIIVLKQVKPKTPKPWVPLHSSLQSHAKLFYNYIAYYVID